jgi:16S rRNA (cytosine1402-N4)-methyltransferase
MNSLIPRHQPAFQGQISSLFELKKGDLFLDLTLGDGGHTQEALTAGARVISLDADIDALNRSRQFISSITPQFMESQNLGKLDSSSQWVIIHGHFEDIGKICKQLDLPGFKGIIADLGTSQYQLANFQRGFSFQHDAVLDMRLDQTQPLTAKDLINGLTVNELEDLFRLGDESFARPIARSIVKYRSEKPITTTGQLVEIIQKIKRTRGKIHPATKIFMALRMAVNLEREALSNLLKQLPDLVLPGGRLGIISFHSGEDRIVKQVFQSLIDSEKFLALGHQPIKPNHEQLSINPKIRSAKLRLVQKKPVS